MEQLAMVGGERPRRVRARALDVDAVVPRLPAAAFLLEGVVEFLPNGPADPCRPRGSDCACESDGGDSDGQGTPQGGGGVRSNPPLGPRSRIFLGV